MAVLGLFPAEVESLAPWAEIVPGPFELLQRVGKLRLDDKESVLLLGRIVGRKDQALAGGQATYTGLSPIG